MKPKIAERPRRRWTRVLVWLTFCAALPAFLLVNGLGIYAGDIAYREINIAYAQTHRNENEQKEQLLARGVERQGWENIEIASSFGYTLKGTFVPHSRRTERTILFLHGFTQNRTAGLDYLPLYQRAGFNVLLVDMRAHGASGGASVTWGAREKEDVDAWLDWLQGRVPGAVIGIHGVSLGAATALLHGQLHEAKPRAAFYIADSAYAALKPLLRQEICTRFGLAEDSLWPDILLAYSDLACWFRERFTFAQSAPIEAVRRIFVPVLYIHGEADRLVPAAMSEALYESTPGKKEMVLFSHAAHAMAFYEDEEKYERAVRDFIGAALEKNSGGKNSCGKNPCYNENRNYGSTESRMEMEEKNESSGI